MEESAEKSKKHWHDRYYKYLLIIPLILILFSIVYMISFYQSNGDIFYKDISLTGGTTLTISEKLSANTLLEDLSGNLEDLNTREIYDLITGEQKAVVLETKTGSVETKEIVENYLGYQLTDENSSLEFTSSIFSENFYKQLLIAILIAFVFMAIVVFIIFRNLVPSVAVIISAFADILMTLVLANILGLKMSLGGIIAFLMLIGYSVDTDIMLTNRILKRTEGSLNERTFGAFKTGLTMTLTSLFAFAIALILVNSFSNVLAQIFTILVIGLGFDILNTWITNVSIIKWYMERKKP